jgi:glutaredoxin 3
MARITMYVTGVCPYCHRAESLLRSKGLSEADLEIIRVDRFPERRQEMIERSGRRTVPQIWVGDRHVGGCDDLHALEAQGGLDALLDPPRS